MAISQAAPLQGLNTERPSRQDRNEFRSYIGCVATRLGPVRTLGVDNFPAGLHRKSQSRSIAVFVGSGFNPIVREPRVMDISHVRALPETHGIHREAQSRSDAAYVGSCFNPIVTEPRVMAISHVRAQPENTILKKQNSNPTKQKNRPLTPTYSTLPVHQVFSIRKHHCNHAPFYNNRNLQ